MECSRVGAGLNLTNLAKVVNQTHTTPTGVYAECVAALGYDPVQRRQQAQQTQPAAGQKDCQDSQAPQ
jgi:hypothetical protein